MTPPRTKPSTPLLSEVARHVVVPSGVVSTGWPSVRDKCADLGIRFRWWQHPIGQIILAKRADGKYAATIGGTGLSIPRQVGKTFLVGAIVFALCLLHPGLTVIWTAHRLRTAEETFGKMQKFAKRAKIKPHVDRIVLGSGEEAITFLNGSRILFGARESGFGLGFDEVDVLIFDEAQRLRDMTLDDMVPATNQSRQPTGALLLFMGTPPRPTDSGEVFTRMRTDCLSGEDTDTGWVEFGADPGFIPTQKPAPMTEEDWRQLAKANPSFPDDTPREAILRMRKQLSADSFPREGYGIWDEDDTDKVFGAGRWAACFTEDHPASPACLVVASAVDQSASCIAAVAPDGDRFHGKPLTYGKGTSWVVAEAKRLYDTHRVPVVVDGKGPAAPLIPHLRAAGVQLYVLDAAQVLDAHASLFQLVQDRRFAHSNYPELQSAVAGATTRPVGDRWMWARRKSAADISPLEAVTLGVGFLYRPQHAPAIHAWPEED